MSGTRKVSSVLITLAPPRRADVSHKSPTSKQWVEPQQRRTEPPPSIPPDLRPPPEEPWSDQEELHNGDLPSFPPNFLDEIPPEDDCLSPDLPPPPPPPPSMKRGPRIPSPPPNLDALNLELQKLEMVHSESQQKAVRPPAPSLVRPQSLPTNQPKREEPTPTKQNINGYNGKTESSEICAFCHKSIPPGAALEAMKKHYHAGCFTCRQCQRLLAGQLYYQKDGQPICEHCYKDSLEKCARCQALIMQHIVRAMGNSYHPECFRCVVCHRPIADESFAVDEFNDVHCADDYYRKYAPCCGVCEQPIIPHNGQDSYKIECLGRSYHENCYRCEKCQLLLSLEPTDSGCFPLKGHLLCKPCHLTWGEELP